MRLHYADTIIIKTKNSSTGAIWNSFITKSGREQKGLWKDWPNLHAPSYQYRGIL